MPLMDPDDVIVLVSIVIVMVMLDDTFPPPPPRCVWMGEFPDFVFSVWCIKTSLRPSHHMLSHVTNLVSRVIVTSPLLMRYVAVSSTKYCTSALGRNRTRGLDLGREGIC